MHYKNIRKLLYKVLGAVLIVTTSLLTSSFLFPTEAKAACSGDIVLEEFDNTGSSASENTGGANVYKGQSFQIPNDATVCGMSWYGGRGTVGTQPSTMKIELLSGSVTGTVIASLASHSNATYPAYTSPAWNKIEFASPVALTAGTTYYLKITALTGSTNDVFRWYVTYNSNPYSDGAAYFNSTTATNHDHDFRIHGVEGAGATSYTTGISGIDFY